MAKVLYTAFMADMRGKVNGTVFSKNKGGAYARTKVTPTNGRTLAQTLVRQSLASFSAGWRGLTGAQREGWNSGAINFPRTDVFGNVKILSGLQLFVSLNQNLNTIISGSLDNVPAPQPVLPFSADSVAVGGVSSVFEVVFTWSDTMTPGSWDIVIMATAPMSPGISFFTNRLRVLGAYDSQTAMPTAVVLGAAYLAKYGHPAVGSRVGFSFYLINQISGQATPPIQLSAVATA